MTTTVVVDPELVLDTTTWVTDRLDPEKIKERPLFTVGEVAKVFFGRSAHWVRWREGSPAVGKKKAVPNYFVLDGKPIEFARKSHDGNQGARKYDLALIEKMAHALAQNEAIDGTQLANAVLAIKTIARIYDYL